jgi:hypothetical protein
MALFGRRGVLNASASFPGLGAGAAQAGGKPKGDDDEDMKKKAEEDDRRKARNRKAGRDEDDDGDDVDDGDDDKDEKGDDESDDDEMKRGPKSAAFRARSRERARSAFIFSSAAAAGREAMAYELAFNTNMSRSAAVRFLERSPKAAAAAPAAPSLNSRMDPFAGHNAGGSAPVIQGRAAIDAGWDNIAAEVAVTTRR